MNFLQTIKSFFKPIKIVTHNGRFHADDVFAIATLQILFKKRFQRIKIIRSRDQKVINSADIVVDVGHIYDPKISRFDHHQTGGGGVRWSGVPYAAFGLVWKHFGKEICGLEEIANQVDKRMIEAIDSTDTGYESFESTKNIRSYLVDDLLKSFGPLPNEVSEDDDFFVGFFLRAVKIARQVLEREILKARFTVESYKYFEEIYKNTKDKRIIVLDKKSVSWSDIVCSKPEILFIIHPKYENHYACRAVPVKPGSFKHRLGFPKEWGGKRGEELEKVSGIKGASFCHMGLHFFDSKTKEGAIEAAVKAIESAK